MDISVKSTGDLNSSIIGNIGIDWKTFNQSRLDLIIKATFDPVYKNKLGPLYNILTGFNNESGQLSIGISGTVQTPQTKKI